MPHNKSRNKNNDNKFRPFPEAKKFTHSLGLKSFREFKAYCKSGKKPTDIPSSPDRVYKKQWKGYSEWLGTGNPASSEKKFRPWPQAREYIRKQGLKNVRDWYRYCRSGKRPDDIPYNPNTTYKQEWKGYPDFLGNEKPQYRPWPEARDYVHKLGIKSQDEWNSYCKSGKLPADIPKGPDTVYKEEWKGLKDWLGYDYRPWPEARDYIHKLGIKSLAGWHSYCKSGKLPADIPKRPEAVYKEHWKNWGDFLGTGRIADQQTGWSIRKKNNY